MVFDLLQIYFFSVILCILFATYILVDRCFSNRIRAYFIVSICTIMALMVVDAIDYVELHKDVPTALHYIDTSLGYIIRPLIAISVCAIFIESNKQKPSTKKKILFFIPYILNSVTVILSPWNKLVYSFNEKNQFVRGSLGYITFVVGFFYMALMLYISVKSVRIKKKGEATVIAMMFILCIIGTMLESLYGFVGFLSMASIIGVVLYYLFLHVSVFSRDGLTGAYNRRIFWLDIQKLKAPTVLVSMDLNNLKKINDNEGHHKGDEFILSFAEEIIRTKAIGSHFYRMGGDEFVLLCKRISKQDAADKMEVIQKRMNDMGYSFAYGITTLSHPDEIDKCMERVDQLMYAKKNEMKSAL